MYIHNNVGEIKENVVGGYDSYLTRDQQFLRNILWVTPATCVLYYKNHIMIPSYPWIMPCTLTTRKIIASSNLTALAKDNYFVIRVNDSFLVEESNIVNIVR